MGSSRVYCPSPLGLYRSVAATLRRQCPGLALLVYSDRDAVGPRREELAAALKARTPPPD